MLLCSMHDTDQVDNVSRALKPAETDLLWNFLVEVALNADDTQRKRLHDELSPGLANVQVCARACESSIALITDGANVVLLCNDLQTHHANAGTELPMEVAVLQAALQQ